jgi:hypothetical protein
VMLRALPGNFAAPALPDHNHADEISGPAA